MTDLNNDQIETVVGGVIAGPNGETCTEPRKETDQSDGTFNVWALLSATNAG